MKSNFAILDVRAGRKALAKRVAKAQRIPVTIRGFIVGQWGDDDGTSIEFSMDVTSVTEHG